MGINSLTHRDDGSKVAVPVSPGDWQQWVSAGRTRNWMLDDPLIDWLQLYGKSRDYLLKQELAGYDKDLDFLVLQRRVMRKHAQVFFFSYGPFIMGDSHSFVASFKIRPRVTL